VIGDSSGICQLTDEESTGEIVIPLGITRSFTRLFTGGRVILPGITISWTKNPSEEKFSFGNYQIMDPDS
jgi:hypothetical protein